MKKKQASSPSSTRERVKRGGAEETETTLGLETGQSFENLVGAQLDAQILPRPDLSSYPEKMLYRLWKN